MFNKVLKVALFLFVFLFPINLFANVADLHLKLPFPAGETWHTSCAYNGTYENNCATHGSWTKDRYALDFNYGNGDADLGKSIRAAAAGRAEIHYGSTGYGNYVLLDHGNGYVTRYAHLQSISVKNNKWVLQGQEVGKCGNTGNSSSTHLHFALYHNGQAAKPEPMGGFNDLSSMGAWYTSANGDPVFRTVAYESDEFKGALVLVREDGQFPQDYPYTSANGDPVFRTVAYESDEFKGALVLVREDGQFPQDCNDIDQTIFYRQWREGGSWSSSMGVISLDWNSGAYEYCAEAAYGGFNDVDLESVIGEFTLVDEGSGGSDPGDEGQTLDGPDANVANGFRVRPVGGDWQEIGGTVSPGQQLEASWFISNKGDETIDYFESC